MHFQLAELIAATGGRLASGSADTIVSGAGIDSRTLEAGSAFFAIVAERDGHDFLPAAVDAGAGAVVVTRTLTADELARLGDVAVVQVADTGDALAALGRAARQRLSGPVIGITGSVGKTSVKDLTRAACSGGRFETVWAAAKSFNNEIGVPLTLVNTPDEADVVVVEMGARGIGHIDHLCRIARPTIGVVTTVALAHSELFGSIEGVAQGKGELVESLPADGVAVLNADNEYVAAMAERTTASTITFGRADTEGGATGLVGPDVSVTDVSLDPVLRPTFVLGHRGRANTVTLEARGAHMAVNAACAVAAAVAAGVDFDDACNQVAVGGLSPWRMEVEPTVDGGVVINDAYNANPTSMRAALDALAAVPAERRIAVVGEMAELGEERQREHEAVARQAVDAGMTVIAVAAPDYGSVAVHVDDIDGAEVAIGTVGAGTVVLVKGSRVAELERLAERLIGSR